MRRYPTCVPCVQCRDGRREGSGFMRIIIDGYNLIRQSVILHRLERSGLERGRQALISRMAAFNKQRRHTIVIVFDGWCGGGEVEERDKQDGIDIIYSRRGEKADDVIKRLIQGTGGETAVVSSDREIAVFAQRRGAAAIPSPDFETVIQRAAVQSPYALCPSREEDGESEEAGRKKKGPSRRPSRKARNLLAAIKKLSDC